MLVRDPIEFGEGALVEFTKTGERILFGKAEYACNWFYRVWDQQGRYFGHVNRGYLKEIVKGFNTLKEAEAHAHHLNYDLAV